MDKTLIDFPIVDSHLHLWDTRLLQYAWLDEVPFLNKPHLLEDYRKACGSIKVEKMVFVQAEVDNSQYREETNWVSSQTAEDPRLEGVVSWAPLEKGERVEAELAALAENFLVKGIRRIIQGEPDPDFCLRPDFIRGVQLLPRYGMSFDICIDHLQMENTIQFVKQCPDVRFILDHIGKPDIKYRLFDPWKRHLKTLSGFSNVFCKISGLVTEAILNWRVSMLALTTCQPPQLLTPT